MLLCGVPVDELIAKLEQLQVQKAQLQVQEAFVIAQLQEAYDREEQQELLVGDFPLSQCSHESRSTKKNDHHKGSSTSPSTNETHDAGGTITRIHFHIGQRVQVLNPGSSVPNHTPSLSIVVGTIVKITHKRVHIKIIEGKTIQRSPKNILALSS